MSPVDLLAWITALLFTAVALDGVRLWHQRRSAAAAWVMAAFGALAGAIIVSRLLNLLPEDSSGLVLEGVRILVVVALLAFPYLLYRFSGSLRPGRDRWQPMFTALAVLVLTLSAAAVAMLPQPGEDGPAWYPPYVALVLGYWTVLGVVVAWRLWRAGSRQPTAARVRMRILAIASILLNVGLLLEASSPDRGSALLPIVTQIVAGSSAVLFALGFSPPAPVRALWRRPEGRRLREAERGLMAATSSSEVAAGLLPPLTRLLGGEGSALYAADGQLLGAHGDAPARPERREAAVRPAVEVAGDNVLLHLENGTAIVSTSPYTPFFGTDEIELAESLATLVDLALGRVELLDRERRTWARLEQANDELQALLYGLSHDLRNPLLTMLGYIDLLSQGHGGTLDEDGQVFAGRIARSAEYMDSLIRDLLELSRVGRIHTESEDVDLTRLVTEIAEEVRTTREGLSITVGSLGAVSMSAVRARQLFTNLMQNAARHGGRAELALTVRSEAADDGSLEISVADNGVGVPTEYRDRLFGMFERLEGGLGTGTGIGLAICKRIMDQLGGTIGLVDAEQGADVRLVFPAGVVLDSAVMGSKV